MPRIGGTLVLPAIRWQVIMLVLVSVAMAERLRVAMGGTAPLFPTVPRPTEVPVTEADSSGAVAVAPTAVSDVSGPTVVVTEAAHS